MDLAGRNVWQVAGGLKERNYVDVLLEWDVFIIGPGDEGPWPDCAPALRSYAPAQIPILQRLADMRHSDVVVLRLGTDQIYGVGEVADDKLLWLDDFGDVDGWDLQIVRRVRWLWKYDGAQPKTFPTYTLKFGPTVLSLDSAPVKEWLTSLEVPEAARNRPLAALPESCCDGKERRQLEREELGEALYDRGIGQESVAALMGRIDELKRIARWYRRAKFSSSEQETVTYLTVPLLLALGWSPQKMSIQWDYIDIGLFDRMPRATETLVAVGEAKKFGDPIRSAFRQAAEYAEKPGRDRCRRLILTDGLRYYVYVRQNDGKFADRPRAYLNLARMVDDYPVLHMAGSKEALAVMANDWSDYVPARGIDLPET